jgi:hypothetical protein
MDRFIRSFPTGKGSAHLLRPTDVDLGNVYTQSGYDVILLLWGALWLLGTLVLVVVAHRAMVAEHAQTIAKEVRSGEVVEAKPANTTARVA